MKTHTVLNKILGIFFSTVLAFVCIAHPLQAKAETDTLDFVETDLSTSEVVELIAGVDDVALGLILGIMGFIVMTYLTLRSVDLPIEGYDQMSFVDKCKSIGQFLLDNADDVLKPFIYSVYLFAQDHPAATIFTIGPFVLTSLPSFYGVLATWLGGSFLVNPSSNLTHVLELFGGSITFYNSISYTYHEQFRDKFNTLSSVPYGLTFGCFSKNTYTAPEYWRYWCYTFVTLPDVLLIYSDSSSIVFNGYTYQGDSLVPQSFTYQSSDSKYSSSGGYSPNLLPSSLTSVTWSGYNTNSRISMSGVYGGFDIDNIFDLLNTLGATIPIGQISVANPSVVNPSDVTWVTDPPAPSEWSDHIYNPVAGTLPIDIVGTWEDIQAALTDLSASTLSIGEMINIIAKNQSLALDSAVDTTSIVQGNSYNFPSLDGVWKYPQYFFDTLKGWGSFVGGCLSAVTVGEGGLSWIFYGGFVLLVCGGIIGKILLG